MGVDEVVDAGIGAIGTGREAAMVNI